LPDGTTTVTLTNEKLFCVNGVCKPCNPTEWAAQIGTLGVAALTCPGYSESISTNIARYATASRLSGSSYTCTTDGDFVWLNTTVDYNYQYPCGNRALWPGGCGNTPTPSSSPAPDGVTSGAASMASGWMLSTAVNVCIHTWNTFVPWLGLFVYFTIELVLYAHRGVAPLITLPSESYR
jgi:hypothetical protein